MEDNQNNLTNGISYRTESDKNLHAVANTFSVQDRNSTLIAQISSVPFNLEKPHDLVLFPALMKESEHIEINRVAANFFRKVIATTASPNGIRSNIMLRFEFVAIPTKPPILIPRSELRSMTIFCPKLSGRTRQRHDLM